MLDLGSFSNLTKLEYQPSLSSALSFHYITILFTCGIAYTHVLPLKHRASEGCPYIVQGAKGLGEQIRKDTSRQLAIRC